MSIFGYAGGAHLTHSIFDTALCQKMAGVCPIPIAVAEARSVVADLREFCMLDCWGKPEFPLSNSLCQVYGLPERRARAQPNVNKRWGFRLGPDAGGEVSNFLIQPNRMIPALRESSLREVLGLFRARGQSGSSPPAHADAFAALYRRPSN